MLESPLHAPTATRRRNALARIRAREPGAREDAIGRADAGGARRSRALVPAESVARNLARHPFLSWDAQANELNSLKQKLESGAGQASS